MPKPKNWMSLPEAVDVLSLRRFNVAYVDLFKASRKNDCQTLFREIETFLLSGDVEALVEIRGLFTPLTAGDLHNFPFRISPRDREGTPGIEIKRNIGAISALSLREAEFRRKIDGSISKIPIEPSRGELKAAFEKWLEAEIVADKWRSKEEIQKVAKNKFNVARLTAFRIRSDLIEKHGRFSWRKAGKRN
jgi:hypothetical protein